MYYYTVSSPIYYYLLNNMNEIPQNACPRTRMMSAAKNNTDGCWSGLSKKKCQNRQKLIGL